MKMHLSITILALAMTNSVVWASPKYRQVAECGTAKVVSGDTCSNVKVEFNFSGCALKSEPQIATRIICTGTQIKARYQTGDYRYEAEYNKVDDGWGAVSWKPLSAVRELKKIEQTAATHAPTRDIAQVPHQAPSFLKKADKPEIKKVEEKVEEKPEPKPEAKAPEPAPAPAAPAAAPQAAATPAPASPEGFKFSGAFDFRYSNYTANQNPRPDYTAPYAESGFGIEDGALYGSFEKNNLSVIADIAFRRAHDQDYSVSALNTAPRESSNNFIVFGVDKSQLYLKYKLNDQFAFDVGQFDTIFGVELNDSKDRIFGKTGIVYDNMIPVTHTGVMTEYASHGFSAKLFAANPNNKGSNGTTTTGDENTEYGGAVGYANDYVHGQLGYMSRPISHADNSAMGNRTLLDAGVGTTLGRFSLDVEYAVVDSNAKNTISPNDNSDHEKPGTGTLALASYKFNDAWLLGARYEHIEDDPGELSVQSGNAFGGAVHYRVRSDLELRAEYNSYHFKDVNNHEWDEIRSNLALLFLF